MRRFLLVFLLVLVSVLVSCELMAPNPEKGKMHIVVYGNNYKQTRYLTGYAPSLSGTVNDAVQVGNALTALAERSGKEWDATYILGTDQHWGGTSLRPTINTILGLPSTDEHTTVVDDLSRAKLKEILADYAENSSSSDVFIFYYSGHGFYDMKKMDRVPYDETVAQYGSFCTSTNKSIPRRLEFYRFSDFLSDISRIPGKKLVLADCCYSGCLVETDGFSVDRVLYPGTLFGYGKGSVEKDLFVLSASQYFNESQDRGEHGEFTDLLLQGLGWTDETQTLSEIIPCEEKGYLTLDSLVSYIKFYNAEEYNNDYKQKVSVTGGSQDFLLFDFH
ncbi:MAG: caspase family protein [Spirochaetales bacterium]|nr:caspase family protein [Candidatus Physcosoma equi]